MTQAISALGSPATRLLRSSGKRILAPWRSLVVQRAIGQGLPPQLRDGFSSLASGALPADVAAVQSKVESLRRQLLAQTDDYLVFPYDARPSETRDGSLAPGEAKRVSFASAARILSVSARWGTFLYQCARAIQAETILELGCAAGISSCYLALVPSCKRFIAIDASADMVALARENLKQSSAHAEINLIENLFDAGLDQLFADESVTFDFAWIDGHHERDATLHYFQRIIPHLRPGSIVAFDDIRWSADMYEAWQVLQGWPGFADTVDAGKLGLGIWQGDGMSPRFWDMTKACPRAHIGTPWGLA